MRPMLTRTANRNGICTPDFNTALDGLFNQFFGSAHRDRVDGAWVPALDFTETDTQFVITAEVPGIDPEKLNITVEDNVLTIAGEKESRSEEQDGNVYHSERRFGSFTRRVRLPRNVNSDGISAEFENGLLSVRLDKDQAAGARKVEVRAKN